MDAVQLAALAQRLWLNLDAEVVCVIEGRYGSDFVAWKREGDHFHKYGSHMVVWGDPVILANGDYLSTREEAVIDTLERARWGSDSAQHMAKIHEIMDGVEWSPDTLDEIAQVLNKAGYEIRDPFHENEIGTCPKCLKSIFEDRAEYNQHVGEC